jgi:hypothetical protein
VNVQKLTRIDESIISDHSKLTADDECYFWREYTSGRNYAFGPSNSLISNLKKKPRLCSPAEIGHKNRVIDECSRFFAGAVDMTWLKDATLVPIPPSKARGHPDFDDRMTRVCRGIRPSRSLDVRSLVIQTTSLEAAHEVGSGSNKANRWGDPARPCRTKNCPPGLFLASVEKPIST